MEFNLTPGNRVQVNMNNGDVYTGKVTPTRSGWTVLALDGGGNVHIKLTKVKSVLDLD